MQSVMFEKVEYRPLNDIAYERIKQKIIDNELLPGEKLDVSLLSASLGVSRTPVVNALKELAQNGFVVICPRSASYVREHSAEEIEYIFDFREVMEGLAVHKLTGKLDVARLRELHARLEGLLHRGGPGRNILDDYLDTALELHRYILQQCPSIVSAKLENLVDLTKRMGKLHLRYHMEVKGRTGITESEIRIHLELAEALLAGHEDLAEELVRRDIRATRDDILRDFHAIEAFARSRG